MMSIRILVIASLLLGGAISAHAEVGGMLGARSTWLAGDSRDDSRLNFAVAGLAMHALPNGFAVGAEAGVWISGSAEVRLIDIVVPVLGRYTYVLGPRHRLRATLGIAPALRVKTEERRSPESDSEYWADIDDVRRWDVAVLVGVGYQYVGTNNPFVELRMSRGLVTIDARDMPLAIVGREIGLWVGVAR